MRKLGAVLVTAVLVGSAALADTATPLNAIVSVDNTTVNMGTARVRVVHASPDAPAVDVLVNDGVVFAGVPFEGITGFAAVPEGTYNVKVVPAGATGPVVIEANLPLSNGIDYTVIATDVLARITPIILTATADQPATGMSWVRFFHGSPDAPAVDIAVTGGPVLFPSVAFQQGTDYLEVPAGTYNLEARVAGTTTVALALPGVALAPGAVYTVYATGLLADSGELSDFYFLPMAARGTGANGSSYHTDVDVVNAGAGKAIFQYLWLPRDSNNAQPVSSERFSLEPGESLRHVDVLAAAFGVTDGTNAFGALAIVSDSDTLKLFSRTYDASGSDGTYGQGVQGIPSAGLIPANAKKRIMFFTENADYRSNLGLLNGTGSPITVRWERFTANGAKVGEGSRELPAWGNVQFFRVFSNEAPVEAAYIDVWTETPGGAFAAYGSVLDNGTNDPITIYPQ